MTTHTHAQIDFVLTSWRVILKYGMSQTPGNPAGSPKTCTIFRSKNVQTCTVFVCFQCFSVVHVQHVHVSMSLRTLCIIKQEYMWQFFDDSVCYYVSFTGNTGTDTVQTPYRQDTGTGTGKVQARYRRVRVQARYRHGYRHGTDKVQAPFLHGLWVCFPPKLGACCQYNLTERFF